MDEEGSASIEPIGWDFNAAMVVGRAWMPPSFAAIATSRKGGMVMTSGVADEGEVPSHGSVLPLGLGSVPSVTSAIGIGASWALFSRGLADGSLRGLYYGSL